MIREGLGLKQRAAFNLVDEAEAAGIMTQITARKAYRIWAVPSLADRIRSRPMPGARGAAMAREPQRAEQWPQVTTASAVQDKEGAAEREAQLLSTLDAALERVDVLLKTPKR